MDGFDWQPQRLTYRGQEYVDSIRYGEVWKKTKEVASKTGVYSLQVLMAAAKLLSNKRWWNTPSIFSNAFRA